MGWLGGIALALLGLLAFGAFMQRRAGRRLGRLLEQVAPALRARVEASGYRNLPQLHYRQEGVEAELSCASNRGHGGTGIYSYVWFRGLRLRQFRFLLRPRHQRFKAGDVGELKLILTADADFDQHFALYSNKPERAQRLFGPALRQELLGLVGPQGNRLDEIRNDATAVVYAWRGLLREPADARALAAQAGRFLSALRQLQA